MSNSLEKIPEEKTSLIAIMASKRNMDAHKFASTIKNTCMPNNASDEEFAAFLMVANQYDLNPITREIYAFPKKGGGIQPVVGIDGWLNLINSHPNMDGIEFEDVFDEKKNLTAIKCSIYRADRTRPISVTEYMEECKRSTEPWTKWPARMLRHKAAIQCARYAFSFSGIIDQDEAERSPEVITNGEVIAPAPMLEAQVSFPEVKDTTTESNDHVQPSGILAQAEEWFTDAKDVDALESAWGEFEHYQEKMPDADADILIGLYETRKSELEAAE